MFRFISKKALEARNQGGLSVESEMQRRTEEEYEREVRDAVLETREIVAVVKSTSKKRKTVDDTPPAPVALPPVPEREKDKPPGKMFAATYDDAATLGKTLAKLEKFTKTYAIRFTKLGMNINFMDRSQVLMVTVDIPLTSFARYQDLVSRAIEFAISSLAVKRFGDLCEAGNTLSFAYDQCGLDKEVLRLMLNPSEGTGQTITMRIPPMNLDEAPGEANDCYQYRVRLSSKVFWKNIQALIKESSTICLKLSNEMLTMSSQSNESQHGLTYTTTAASNEAEYGDNNCLIERLEGADPKIKMSDLRAYQLSAAFLQSTAAFGNVPHCSEVVLRLGVQLYDGAYIEEPLHASFPMRTGTPGAFKVDVWIAAKVNDEDK